MQKNYNQFKTMKGEHIYLASNKPIPFSRDEMGQIYLAANNSVPFLQKLMRNNPHNKHLITALS